jgi:hypothetical protein
MCLLYVLHLNLGLQVNAGDGLRETNDGLKLADRNGNTSALLGDLLVLVVHAVLHVHVLQNVACLL